MKSFIVVAVLFAAVTYGFQTGRRGFDPLDDAFIRKVNENVKTWRAKRFFPRETTIDQLRRLTGVLPDFKETQNAPVRPRSSPLSRAQNLPKHFDARKNWLNCPVIEEVQDQGDCGSCWAVSAVGVMTDRTCIASNGTENFHYSIQDLLTCCSSCGFECNGGYPYEAFKYWTKRGIVSGGPYESNEGCSPYLVPPTGESQEFDSIHRRQSKDLPTRFTCNEHCRDSYDVAYEDDLHLGGTSYAIALNQEEIMNELVTNGPVVATMAVYADFFSYESGVYSHDVRNIVGYHAIRMIGYGEENGIPYWICANSWGSSWGEKGFFRILRGENESEIEGGLYAGIPM